jgi:excinuclease ABC subunit C
MERFEFLDKSELNQLPKVSGVYCFRDKIEAIYIGKAIHIQSRVKNHFNQPSYRDNLFMDKVEKVGYFETNSEIEALVLEANLIKKYQPRFNVVWRDDKNYFYVAIEKNAQKIPFIYITHQKKSGVQYIGPFVEGTALKKTLKYLRRAFPYYTTKNHPKTKCTWCHLGLCPGPDPDLTEYKNNLKQLSLILEGKRGAVLRALKQEMNLDAKNKKFEDAAKIRDRMNHLQQVMLHANVISNITTPIAGWENTKKILQGLLNLNSSVSRIECYDISNIQGKMATGSMVVFTDGQPDKNQYRKFKIKMENEPNDIAMLKEIITRRLARKEWSYPEVMLIDGGIAQLNVAIRTKNENSETKNIKVISIAKKDKDLYIERPKGYPTGFIPLKSLPQEIYNLIIHLDDEAHRFAIAYHKKLRKKQILS